MNEERIFIALGSNLGDRLAYLGKAVLMLSQHPGVAIVGLSSVYETEPVGYADQDPFYNMVAEVRTTLSPQALLDLCLKVEQKLGRVRTVKNGPRTIDLDLLFYGKRIQSRDPLILPHPRLHERAFVLAPLADLAADWIHPVLGKSVAALLSEVEAKGVKRLEFHEGS